MTLKSHHQESPLKIRGVGRAVKQGGGGTGTQEQILYTVEGQGASPHTDSGQDRIQIRHWEVPSDGKTMGVLLVMAR